MRLKCLARELTVEQRKGTNAPALFAPRFQITEGRAYLVLGIEFLVNSPVYGNCCLFAIQDDAGKLVSAPSMLFEVVDGRVSKYWRAGTHGEFCVMLWPEEFYKDYFHDRVTDGDADAREDLKAVVSRLETETCQMT
jgi:hypothetical protein